MKYIISVLISYLIGGFSPSTLLGRKKGIPIREMGSKNAGASNTFLLIGPKYGVLVASLDIIKGALCVILARLYAPELTYIGVLSGVSAVIGHIFPIHMKFQGGKGVATYLGMVLALDWPFAIFCGILLLVLSILTNYIISGIFVSVISYPIFIAAYKGDIISSLAVAIASLLVIVKHSSNVKRFIRGEEYQIRTGIYYLFSKSKSKSGEKE